jgi:hypothetical protein
MPPAPKSSLLAVTTACVTAVAVAPQAQAKVFYARDEALGVAFPGATRTEARDFFLTAAQRQRIEELAKSKLESDLVTVYAGYNGDHFLGWAIFDTHIVRTLPETFLVVMSPDGTLTGTHVLAFYEPLEYLPSDRWLAQFNGKHSDDDLQIGREIAAITGSSLTSQAVAGGIRRALGLYSVLLRDQ